MQQEIPIHYQACPSCNSADIKAALTARDHTVSQKDFAIWECGNCSLRFTQDVPDADTIGPYYKSEDYISHTNTRKGLINNLYHIVRKQTLSGKRRLLSSATRLKRGKMLDLGAGAGSFVAHMAENGWEVTGLEPDETARNIASSQNRTLLLPMSDFYSLAPESYDAITLWHVLEHVHDLHAYVGQLARLLKKEGRIFIAVPNYTSYDAAVYKGTWAAYDVPRHLYHFSPAAMEDLLAKHDLQLQAIRPMWFDSYYISLLSEKYRNGKGNLVKAFLTGFISNLRAFVDKSRCSSLIYVIGK
jgi:2-polyprenyl-3-methyl-5-hydroxy-6-metoxy-1,4-benzoquinol methylase